MKKLCVVIKSDRKKIDLLEKRSNRPISHKLQSDSLLL